jgi:predicted kinase
VTRPLLLIAFSGLPGTGKSTIARALAGSIGAVWLRIDTIEQAIRRSGIVRDRLDDAGYRAAYGVAADNLRLGLSVVADCVNDCALTRDAWREVEVVCGDRAEHRRRVETRSSEIVGLDLPTWAEIEAGPYEPWDRHRMIIDTARFSPDKCVAALIAAL